VDGLTVRDAWVNIGDDCFSPKPNTSNILVTNIYCNGTHGISMGSIGQYSGVKDYIYNAYIENVTMLNAQASSLSDGFTRRILIFECRTELALKRGLVQTLATDTSIISRIKTSTTSMWIGPSF
jgi:hypothetical protein